MIELLDLEIIDTCNACYWRWRWRLLDLLAERNRMNREQFLAYYSGLEK